MKEINRKKLGTLCLVIATFLNPLGYDVLVFGLTKLTGNYWTTIHILYVCAALFFGLFFFFYRINPWRLIINRINKILTSIKSYRDGKPKQ
jgi:hypothetical protein